MKYRFLFIFVILIFLLNISVTAQDYTYTISPNENFTSVRRGDDMSEVAQKLNMTTNQLNTHFKDGLIYLAVSDDTKTQIKISSFSDNFSSEVGDISRLDDVGIKEFSTALNNDSENECQTILNNQRKFICIKHTLSDSGGVYTVTQYVTICNNKTFYFVGYNPGEDTSSEILAAFESFSLSENKDPAPNYTTLSVLIIIGIILFSALAIIMIVGLIKQNITYKKGELSNE